MQCHQNESDMYARLRAKNRMYESELKILRQRKCTFRAMLDVIYPRMDKCFKGHASLYDSVPMEVLKKYPRNRKAASEELGISERTLYRKINEYGIDLKKKKK